MDSEPSNQITNLAFTSCVSGTAYGLTEDLQVFRGHGPQEFEDRSWEAFGHLVGTVVLGRPMQVLVGECITATSIIIAPQRLPVTIEV